MRQKLKRNILFFILWEWFLSAVILCVCFTISYYLLIPGLLFCVWLCELSRIWLPIAFAVRFSKPKTITTKGYRSAYRMPVSPRKTKHHYSVILFDDPNLKGKYYSLDEALFRHGEELEIIYYPRSRYICSIQRIKDQK